MRNGLQEFSPLVNRQLRHSLRDFADVTAVSQGTYDVPAIKTKS